MLQDKERFLDIRITVGIFGAELVPRQMFLGRLVEAIGQSVGERMPREGVGALAGGTVPHGAAAGSIDVDTHHKGVIRLMPVTDGDAVDPAAAFLQGDNLSFNPVFRLFRVKFAPQSPALWCCQSARKSASPG